MPAGEPKLKRIRPRRYFLPYFVLLLGLLITAFATFYVWRTAHVQDLIRFGTTTQELTTHVRGRPRFYIEVLRAGTGLFAISPTTSASQFHNFVDRLELRHQYPGAQGIGYMARVKREQKDSFISEIRTRNRSDFKIWPEQDRDEYDPVVYFEPLDDRQYQQIGYDMNSEPALRSAMETARDTGLPATTARVTLNPDGSDLGFLIYAPIYKDDRTPTTDDERRDALAGFVFSRFRGADFMKAILAIKNTTDIDIRIHDGQEPTNENLIHDSATVAAPVTGDYRPFRTQSHVEVAGRTWTLAFSSRPEFATSIGNSLVYVVVGGLLISLLLFGLTHAQVRSRAATERTASELQISESKVRKTLSDRERAEAALRESEERYRELIENANDIMFTLDLDGNVTSINSAVERLTGFSREELLKMNMRQFLTSGSDTAAREMTHRKLAGEERTNYEVDVRTKHGTLVRLEISSRLAFKSDKPIGIQGVARDITRRRAAEEALREADQRALSEYERLLERVSLLSQALGTARELLHIFRALQEFAVVSAPCDGIFVSLYDPIRDVRTACYGWGDQQEIDTSELPPMPVTATGPNSIAVRTGEVVVTNDYMKVRRNHHPGVIVGPDNGLRPKSSLAAPMSVMGRIVGTIEIQSYEAAAYREEHVTAMRMAANLVAVAIENVRLLNQESTARATAEESNRLKDEFLATVSHELRTPLTAILGWSRMLQSESLDEATAVNAIETIRRNAKAQSQIIDDILDVSRIITGKLAMDLHPLELAPIIEEAVDVVRPTAEAKGLRIQTELPAQPMVVAGDSNRLQQIVWNLLSNAIKFTPSGGRVFLKVQEMGPQVEIKVNDDGQGISKEFLPFVFDRFRQADSTTTRQHGGLGLGLAIARHLVEIHGGAIKAASDGANKGSTFSVLLPRLGSNSKLSDQRADDSSQPPDLASSRLKGIHILLVDDDEDALRLMTAALAQGEAKVTAVSSAEAAIETLKILTPDVLISDIAMPNEDGYQLLARIRALDLDHLRMLPAVAITAYAREEDRLQAFASGFQAYLAKPIELSELITVVAETVKAAELRREVDRV